MKTCHVKVAIRGTAKEWRRLNELCTSWTSWLWIIDKSFHIWLGGQLSFLWIWILDKLMINQRFLHHHSLKKRPKISHKTRGSLLQELAQATSKSGSRCIVAVKTSVTMTITRVSRTFPICQIWQIWSLFGKNFFSGWSRQKVKPNLDTFWIISHNKIFFWKCQNVSKILTLNSEKIQASLLF